MVKAAKQTLPAHGSHEHTNREKKKKKSSKKLQDVDDLLGLNHSMEHYVPKIKAAADPKEHWLWRH